VVLPLANIGIHRLACVRALSEHTEEVVPKLEGLPER
jgi:hypothetical protein